MPSDVVQIGTEFSYKGMPFKVIEVDMERRRLMLERRDGDPAEDLRPLLPLKEGESVVTEGHRVAFTDFFEVGRWVRASFVVTGEVARA